MHLTFSSPWGSLVAAAVVAPLCFLVIAELRVWRVRSALRLGRPPLRAVVPAALAVCAVPVLLGLAAAQPTLRRTTIHHVRTDAAAFFVIDTSRSMLAAPSAGATTRFERARSDALALRSDLADLPAGIASLTDRLLPHLFPTESTSAFRSTLERAIGVERPPPERVAQRATTLFGLTALSTQNYFADSAKRRVVIVFTDGESSPFDQSELANDFRGAHIRPVFIHVWNDDERVFGKNGKAESYRPDPASSGDLDRLARAAGGRVFSEHDLGDAATAVRAEVGNGPRVVTGRDESSYSLTPYAAFAALLALAFVLWQRNLWGLVRIPDLPARAAEPI